MLDSHHPDRVVEVIEPPCGESRLAGVDDERQHHHAKDAATLRDASSCQSAKVRVLADSATAGVRH